MRSTASMEFQLRRANVTVTPEFQRYATEPVTYTSNGLTPEVTGTDRDDVITRAYQQYIQGLAA